MANVRLRTRVVAFKTRWFADPAECFQHLNALFLRTRNELSFGGRPLRGVLQLPELDREFTCCCPPADQQYDASGSQECTCPLDMKERGPVKCDVG